MKFKITYCLLGVLMTVACAREADTEIPEGMLRANIVQPDTDTRTSFDGGTGKFRWSEGDKIAIHMSTGYYTEAEVDYRTGFFECPTTESRYRNYYAVYPASIAVEDAYGNPDLDVVLPAMYDISEKLTSDYSPLPMIAVNREAESDLYFNHAGGLIRIILNDVAAEAAQARVTFEHNVTGIFRVHWASEKLPYISDGGDGAVVTFQLAESTLGEVTNGIRLNVPVPTGHYGEVKVEVLNTGGAALSTIVSDIDWDCARGHGKLFDLETSAYTFTGSDSVSLPAYPANTSRNGWLTSYKRNNTTNTAIAVPWHVAGYYADEACETPYDGEDASNAPYWLTSFGENGNGGAGAVETWASFPIVYGATNATLLSETYSAEAQGKNARIASSSFGAGSSLWNYLNLSNPSDRNSDYIAESANCYIVNGPGYYRIPLVMGNGVIENQPNPVTNAWQGLSTGYANVVFSDYKGEQPVSPYLHKSSASVGVPTSAFVVWEDEEHLIEAINTVDYTLPESPLELKNDVWWLKFHVAKPVQGNAVIAVVDQNGDVMWSWHIWVTDFIPENYGGEAGITVKAHDPSYRYEMMSVNLGWVVSGLQRSSRYEADEVYVRLVQEGSGFIKVMELSRPVRNHTETLCPYYEPLYQWGRKDAMQSGIKEESLPSCYGRYPVPNPNQIGNSNVPLYETILNPQSYIFSGASFNNAWFTSAYSLAIRGNLWNAADTGGGIQYNPVLKTIYDPCPAGYCMPPAGAFTGFCNSEENECSFQEANARDLNGDGVLSVLDNDGGVYFYTDATQSNTLFLPNTARACYYSRNTFEYGDGGLTLDHSGCYMTAAVDFDRTSSVRCFHFNATRIYLAQHNATAAAVRPVADKRPVFGGSGSNSGATTTGVAVDVHDMGGSIWE